MVKFPPRKDKGTDYFVFPENYSEIEKENFLLKFFENHKDEYLENNPALP